ncbi:MAG: cyclic nucleotide-binding domain-containing protein [Bacteroidota bacterium]
MSSLLQRLPPPISTPLRRLLRQPEDPRLEAAVSILAGCPLFACFRRADLYDLARHVHTRDYDRGEVIYFARDPGLGLYVVVHGAVSLCTRCDDGGVGSADDEVVHRVGPGGTFGERALLGEHRRATRAEAADDTRVLGFFRPDFKTLIKRHPKLGTQVALAVGQYLAAREALLRDALSASESPVAVNRLLYGLRVPDGTCDPMLFFR